MSAEILSFETGRPAETVASGDEVARVVDGEGFDGARDIFVALAPPHKVDRANI